MKSQPKAKRQKSISLAPLSFDDAIGGLLGVKPTPKAAKKKPAAKKAGRKK